MPSGSWRTFSSVPSSILLTNCMIISWNISSRRLSSIRKILRKVSADLCILSRLKKGKSNPTSKNSATHTSSSPLKLSTSWVSGMLLTKITKPQITPSFMISSKKPKFPSPKMIRNLSSSSLKKRISSSKIIRNGFRNYLKSKRNRNKLMIKKTATNKVRNPSNQIKK